MFNLSFESENTPSLISVAGSNILPLKLCSKKRSPITTILKWKILLPLCSPLTFQTSGKFYRVARSFAPTHNRCTLCWNRARESLDFTSLQILAQSCARSRVLARDTRKFAFPTSSSRCRNANDVLICNAKREIEREWHPAFSPSFHYIVYCAPPPAIVCNRHQQARKMVLCAWWS